MAETGEMSFADTLYSEIDAVIGGSNPNQFFCMGLPGTLLDPDEYSYDIENHEPKPAHVKANESKLANKLFDACLMTASDNGRHLYTQYRTALNMLMPKMNGKLFDAKTKLRKALMTPYPYNFGDGSTDVLTLEQVFYKLYGEYVEAKQAWSIQKLSKKTELAEKYPEASPESYIKRQDEYLDWYGNVAETQELAVKEKLGKVLNVFSPGDMEIINGILDSGVGRELSEARNVLENTEELDPDGGVVFPVTLYPQDWFKLLDTSFTPVDLLESPAALSQQLHMLEMQRSNINLNVNKLLQALPDEGKIKELKENYDNCQKAFDDNFKDYIGKNTEFTMDMFRTAIDIIGSSSANPEEAENNIPVSTQKRIFGVEGNKLTDVINTLSNGISSCLEAQNKLTSSAEAATDSALEWCKNNNKMQLRSLLEPLKQQQDDINAEIAALKEKIRLASIVNPDESEQDGQAEKSNESSVAPNKVPDRFTQIIINKKLSSASTASSMSSSSSQSHVGVSFLFGGYSSNKSHQESVSEEMSTNSDVEVQIGMSAAKVQIEREWFNPGVFLLTSDMYNTSSQKISPVETGTDDLQKRFASMNECVFPCYPTAFVVAKDVTIKFSSQKAMSSSFAQSIEDHSSSGGGFFIFGGSSASSSSSAQSNSTATSTAHSVTVRFTTPQIIGYYLETVPPDRSSHISSAVTRSDDDFISVFEFIEKFKEMLDEQMVYNKQMLVKGDDTNA